MNGEENPGKQRTCPTSCSSLKEDTWVNVLGITVAKDEKINFNKLRCQKSKFLS